MRVVPIRGLAAAMAGGLSSLIVRPFDPAPGRSRLSRGGRIARTEAVRPVDPKLLALVDESPLLRLLPPLLLAPAVLAFSESGGGVGGSKFRFSGGSNC